jgi:ParB-like chromosome segregation protein Spo0J
VPERTRAHRGTNYVISPAHPAADAFPWLDDDALQGLADDIAANGQQSKVVVLPDGRVIDGRNRELACRVAGVVPQYRKEDLAENAIVAFVVTANLHRRELTASQRAMIGAELATMRQGERTDKEPSAPVQKVPADATKTRVSQAAAAKKMDVSERSVASAAKVKATAPELVEVVKQGALDVKTAAKVADLPEQSRKKVAASAEPKKAAKTELEKHKPPARTRKVSAAPSHPFESLMSAVTSLTTNLTRAVNAGDEHGERLKHVLTTCALLDYPAEMGGNPRFLPLAGVRALLDLAGSTGKLPKDETIKVAYAKANGTWVPPLVMLRRDAKAKKQ